MTSYTIYNTDESWRKSTDTAILCSIYWKLVALFCIFTIQQPCEENTIRLAFDKLEECLVIFTVAKLPSLTISCLFFSYFQLSTYQL